ncbi:hypothetical protein [Rhizobium sp. BK379]|uniref:hypothetical protein n=1 Tax=Rhizobium sp. BK379 TaxID=2587059 RepID=UPI00160E7D06|nr:hypothetical protein [Rhizobium sp. BK379]MBB3444436.1 hypothetical protein [Rhizobium sp. BK379]
MVNITGMKQSLLRRLLKRADYATLDLKPEAGADHAAETTLIEQIRAGMIAPEDYPASTSTGDAQAGGEQASSQNEMNRTREGFDTEEQMEFAVSSNGDRWFLCFQSKGDAAFVLHRANLASGAHETRRSVDAFLNLKPIGPEHEALRALLRRSMEAGS